MGASAVKRCRVPSIGFLHTANIHEPNFRALVVAAGRGAFDQVHYVDETLLADVRRTGPDGDLRNRIRTRLHALRGVDVIVCTCSTIGGEAEQIAAELGVAFVRIDRPMAELAVAEGGRVGIAAALESTIAPTRALLLEAAASAGVEVDTVAIDCRAAWPSFEGGATTEYLAAVVNAIRESASREPFRAVVLAQASMADAAPLLAGEPYSVFSSPQPAVDRAIELASNSPKFAR